VRAWIHVAECLFQGRIHLTQEPWLWPLQLHQQSLCHRVSFFIDTVGRIVTLKNMSNHDDRFLDTPENLLRNVKSYLRPFLQRIRQPSSLTTPSIVRMDRQHNRLSIEAVFRQIFQHMNNTHTSQGLNFLPASTELKSASLRNCVFRANGEFPPHEPPDHDQSHCGICYEEFRENENIINTTCCHTKFLHILCGVQCLRRSDVCPFCRSAKISFS